jgi:RNA polymerase sigma-70 factor (ECF subfamily)
MGTTDEHRVTAEDRRASAGGPPLVHLVPAARAPRERRMEPALLHSGAMKVPPPSAHLDPDSREWLRALRARGVVHDQAVARLHALLLGAARFEVARRRPALGHLRGDELPDIAMEAADDALMSVLRRLDDFRGDSRFTTWAYKFALLEAAVKLRRRAWQGREVPIEPEAWALLARVGPTPHEDAEQAQLVEVLQQGIREILTPHQRRVLVALALNGVPIDVLAERLQTTRGALYKTLHDARRKLRAHLGACGVGPDRLAGGSR